MVGHSNLVTALLHVSNNFKVFFCVFGERERGCRPGGGASGQQAAAAGGGRLGGDPERGVESRSTSVGVGRSPSTVVELS